MNRIRSKTTIGRLEKIDFPDLSIFNLDAKIDTGAYTSSLHCHHIQLEKKNGDQWVHFSVLDPDHPEYQHQFFERKVFNIKKVKSSNGIVDERIVIKQATSFCGQKHTIELTLADRSLMKYPVLLGRKFLMNRYIVDVSKTYLSE